MSPETLTHIVYVVLILAFIGTMSYMVFYNLRSKAREKQMEANGKPYASQEAAIMAAQGPGKQRPRP